MYETATVDKDQFEKGLSDVINDVAKNGQQYYFVGIPLNITKGVVYVVEKLGVPFVVKLVGQFLNDERIVAARFKYGCKNLLILEIKHGVAKVSLHINDIELATAIIKDRPDLPDVRVAMIMGQQVLYLVSED